MSVTVFYFSFLLVTTLQIGWDLNQCVKKWAVKRSMSFAAVWGHLLGFKDHASKEVRLADSEKANLPRA